MKNVFPLISDTFMISENTQQIKNNVGMSACKIQPDPQISTHPPKIPGSPHQARSENVYIP